MQLKFCPIVCIHLRKMCERSMALVLCKTKELCGNFAHNQTMYDITTGLEGLLIFCVVFDTQERC